MNISYDIDNESINYSFGTYLPPMTLNRMQTIVRAGNLSTVIVGFE
jgi:hypothetical protein